MDEENLGIVNKIGKATVTDLAQMVRAAGGGSTKKRGKRWMIGEGNAFIANERMELCRK